MRDTHPAHVSGMFDDRERGVFVPIDRVRAFGGWTPAIVYSQLAYWYQKMRRPFYKTAASLAEELALSERTVERALAKLRDLGVIETTVRKVKNTPVNHFAVNYRRHDELVLAARESRMASDSAKSAESDSVNMAESMDSAKMTESYTGEYLQELTEKTLSAGADTATKASTSSAKKEAAASASLTPLPFSATASASPTSPSPQPPSQQRTVKPGQVTAQQLDALVAAYNAARGPLPQAMGRNTERDKKLRRIVAEATAKGLDPVEVMTITTAYLTGFDVYNGKKDGKRYGLDTVLRHLWKYYEMAVAQRAAEQPQVKLTPGAVMTLIEGMHKEVVRLLDAEPQDGLVRVERLRRRSDGVWVGYHESRVAVKNLRPDDPGRR